MSPSSVLNPPFLRHSRVNNPPTIPTTGKSLIIQLDQKDWIALAQGYYGVAPRIAPIAKMVIEAADSGRVIFPLSIIHLDETARRLEPTSRYRLAELMVRISKGWSILPAPRIIQSEVEDACLKHLGLRGYDLRSYAIGKGLSHLMGAKIRLVTKKPLPIDIEKQLLDAAEAPNHCYS